MTDRVRCAFYKHPKFLTLDTLSRGFWVRLLAHCEEHRTAYIREDLVFQLFDPGPGVIITSRQIVARLLDAHLLQETQRGYLVCDYPLTPEQRNHDAKVRAGRARIATARRDSCGKLLSSSYRSSYPGEPQPASTEPAHEPAATILHFPRSHQHNTSTDEEDQPAQSQHISQHKASTIAKARKKGQNRVTQHTFPQVTPAQSQHNGKSPESRQNAQLEPLVLNLRNIINTRSAERARARDADLTPFEADFSQAWSEYPAKTSRKMALNAYTARRREGVSAEDLLTAVRRYVTFLRFQPWRKPMYASTFFGPNERWLEFFHWQEPTPYNEPPGVIR